MRSVWVCLVLVCVLAAVEGRKQHGRKGRKHHGHAGSWINRSPDTGSKYEIRMKKISWLNVPEVQGCVCQHRGEICIEGPDHQPTCVHKHHLQESARLFKHYHDRKEKAEEELNEIDPRPHSIHLDPTKPDLDAPHDLHINVVSRHQEASKVGHDSMPHVLGLQAKPGKQSTEERLIHSVQASEDNHPGSAVQSGDCDTSALAEMQSRLVSWFHLLHSEHHHRHHHGNHRHLSVKKELRDDNEGGRCECLRSVMWEFRQLDVDGDHELNSTEIRTIDNNDLEPCLHPYLLTCDLNADGRLSRQDWCCCFPQKKSENPCYAKLRAIEATKNTEKYIPNCDKEGFYQKEQCVTSEFGVQTCWCVTPGGSEIPGSRAVGRAHCGKLDRMGYPKGMA